MIEELIDGLTNSVVEVATGRKYATDIHRVELAEINALSQEGWRFDWGRQLVVGEVYGLQIPKAGRAIHGLMSLSILEELMEPNFEQDDVDLVIASGHWNAEILAEVAEFFRGCDDDVSSFAISEANPRIRTNAAATDVIRPVVPGT